jgi:hypothetical protein
LSKAIGINMSKVGGNAVAESHSAIYYIIVE